MIKVVVSEPEFEKAASVFESAPGFKCIPASADEARLSARIRATGSHHVVVGTQTYLDELYQAIPRGGVIARFGVGHDGIDKEQARSRGILCTNTPGVLDDSVAELAIGLMLALARHIAVCGAEAGAGKWNVRLGTELAGKTLAVIGLGSIGKRVAAIARNGFRMNVVACGTAPRTHPENVSIYTQDFSEAVANADFVSVHIAATPATHDFLDAKRLTCMRPAALLVNTARGSVLDEDSLYDAINAGNLAGAALDVFKAEPYVPQTSGKDLRNLDRVLMTPHIGSSSREACDRMAEAVLRNIAFAEGGKYESMNLIGPPS